MAFCIQNNIEQGLMCQLWFKFKSAKLKMAVIRRGICLQFIKKGFYVRLRMFSFIKLMFALLLFWCVFFAVPFITFTKLL